MNVMLTRLPDGTVNAQPGDAVEVWDGMKWEGGWTVEQVRSRFIDLTFSLDHETVGFQMECHAIRHARGGAGHLRLQVARLREAVERVQRGDLLNPDFYKQWLTAAIEDTENYEYTEPEA